MGCGNSKNKKDFERPQQGSTWCREAPQPSPASSGRSLHTSSRILRSSDQPSSLSSSMCAQASTRQLSQPSEQPMQPSRRHIYMEGQLSRLSVSQMQEVSRSASLPQPGTPSQSDSASGLAREIRGSISSQGSGECPDRVWTTSSSNSGWQTADYNVYRPPFLSSLSSGSVSTRNNSPRSGPPSTRSSPRAGQPSRQSSLTPRQNARTESPVQARASSSSSSSTGSYSSSSVGPEPSRQPEGPSSKTCQVRLSPSPATSGSSSRPQVPPLPFEALQMNLSNPSRVRQQQEQQRGQQSKR